MSKSPRVLENGRIFQEQIEELVGMASQNLKTLMVDYETPIKMRLEIAFKLFENFSTTKPAPRRKETAVHCIEKNARDIKENAHILSHIEALLVHSYPRVRKYHKATRNVSSKNR